MEKGYYQNGLTGTVNCLQRQSKEHYTALLRWQTTSVPRFCSSILNTKVYPWFKAVIITWSIKSDTKNLTIIRQNKLIFVRRHFFLKFFCCCSCCVILNFHQKPKYFSRPFVSDSHPIFIIFSTTNEKWQNLHSVYLT